MEFEKLRELLKENRTYRRFDASVKIDTETLRRLVELTRYCASGRNIQPLRYRLVNSDEECAALYPALGWAGYYKDWDGPEPAERPTAYLVQCLDKSIAESCLCDDGLQLEAITLGAVALGLGGCIIKSFNMQIVREVLNLPENLQPLYVLALGKPAERVILEDLKEDYKYYRDAEQGHHVPKRVLSELIV